MNILVTFKLVLLDSCLAWCYDQLYPLEMYVRNDTGFVAVYYQPRERKIPNNILLFVVGTPLACLRKRDDLTVVKHCWCLPQSPI